MRITPHTSANGSDAIALFPLLTVMMFLLCVHGAAHAQAMETFTNDRESAPMVMADFYADFSVSYPASWIIASHPEENGAFFKVYHAMKYNGNPSFVSDQFTIGPLLVSAQENDSLTLALVMQQAALFEKTQFGMRVSGFKHVHEGTLKVDGLQAFEIRTEGAADIERRAGAAGYGRFIFVLPTATNDGLTIGLTATSASTDVHGSDDVGVKGEMAAILKSVKIPRHRKADLHSMRTFVNTREKTITELQSDFFGFSLDFPRTWNLRTSAIESHAFVTLRRGVVRAGISDFSTDAISVSPLDYRAGSDSARRAILITLTDTLEHQVAASMASFERVSRGQVRLDGRDGLEFRYRGTMPGKGAAGVTYYGRLILISPTSREPGTVIDLHSTSLSAGVAGPQDVGEKGDLGAVLRSFKFRK
ncbi:MAG: hypothetical protein JST22_04960 [Bacteroidetes bacterium]|nr:hypothetical protein [Bacteroidota bacterium]